MSERGVWVIFPIKNVQVKKRVTQYAIHTTGAPLAYQTVITDHTRHEDHTTDDKHVIGVLALDHLWYVLMWDPSFSIV
jgi:hypothetical protein